MTSLRQIEANRRNALKSTGPKTDNGKRQASQNAVRHGLTAETVLTPLEDPEDYIAFEQAVTADYQAETAVERELVLRLASLLWRLRRATSIETGLLQLEPESVVERSHTDQDEPVQHRGVTTMFRRGEVIGNPCGEGMSQESPVPETFDDGLGLARRFLRLADLDHGGFDRLGRYEAALWRQLRQTLFTLEALRWQTSNTRRWRGPGLWQRTMRSPSEE